MRQIIIRICLTHFSRQRKEKNVEFKFEEIPTTDAYNQKIKLLISSGDLPDIVFNGGNNITALADRGRKSYRPDTISGQ